MMMMMMMLVYTDKTGVFVYKYVYDNFFRSVHIQHTAYKALTATRRRRIYGLAGFLFFK